MLIIRATPHKDRLTALRTPRLHLFRHVAQISLDRRQPACTRFAQSDEKSALVEVEVIAEKC